MFSPCFLSSFTPFHTLKKKKKRKGKKKNAWHFLQQSSCLRWKLCSRRDHKSWKRRRETAARNEKLFLIRTTRRREEPAPRPSPALQNARFCVTTFAWLTTEKRWRRDTGELRVGRKKRAKRRRRRKKTHTHKHTRGREREKKTCTERPTYLNQREEKMFYKKKKRITLFFSARSPVGLQTFRVACCSLLGAAGVQTLSSNSIF